MNKRKLLSPEREQIILSELGNKARTITELSEKLGVSEATVRRDLQSLENQKKIHRIHGGALRENFPHLEPVFTEKESLHAEEKENIAELALRLIRDGDTVYLDGGSTVLALARKIKYGRKLLTIVTNSLVAAAELMESGHRLIIVGGEFRALSRTVVGPVTSHTINTLHIDKAFLGTIGFTCEDGISTTDPNEAYTKELVMRRSRKVILLADSSKLGAPSFCISGTINDIDVIITDPAVPEKFANMLKKKKIEVIF